MGGDPSPPPTRSTSLCARHVLTPGKESPHVEEAHDLKKTAHKAVAHTPDHGESDADKDGVGQERRPRTRVCAGESQEDAAGGIQRVVAQRVGSEALGGDEVIGGDGGGGANPAEDHDCEVRDGHDTHCPPSTSQAQLNGFIVIL